jgi:hypothetical protein
MSLHRFQARDRGITSLEIDVMYHYGTHRQGRFIIVEGSSTKNNAAYFVRANLAPSFIGALCVVVHFLLQTQWI